MLKRLFIILLVLAGVAVTGATFLPGTWQEVILSVPVSGAASSVQLPVTFRYPHELPDGEQVLFEMTVTSNGTQEGTTASPVQLEGRLELAGVDLFPAEILRVPYHPGQTFSFRWLVTAHPGTAENGTLWLVAVGIDGSKQETRFPMIARPIQVELRQVLGMSFFMARWVGSGMIGIGLISVVWLLLQRKNR